MPLTTGEKVVEEQRREWINDLVIINWWLNGINNAPNDFFDDLMETARGTAVEDPARLKPATALALTTARERGEKPKKGKSQYSVATQPKTPRLKAPTRKGWGRKGGELYDAALDGKERNNDAVKSYKDRGTGKWKRWPAIGGKPHLGTPLPTKEQIKAGQKKVQFVVTTGLDIGSYAYEKGPVSFVEDIPTVDRNCNNCGLTWKTPSKWKDSKTSKKCPKCRKENDFKEGVEYVRKESNVKFTVGMKGDGQTIGIINLKNDAARKYGPYLRVGDSLNFKGYFKGGWEDINSKDGRPSGKKSDQKWRLVPSITLGAKKHGGFIEIA